MANKHVVETECDQCGTTVFSDIKESRATVLIPENWIQVRVDTKTSTLFTRDLCPDCKMGILNAAGYSPRKNGKGNGKK